MKKRNRCLVIVLVIALLLATADTGVSPKKANAATETVAYLEFLDSWWFDATAYKNEANSKSKVIADNATIDGDGVYRISLDFTQADNYGYAHGLTNCIIRITNGEEVYGSKSLIQLRSVKMINAKKEEKILDLNKVSSGYTCSGERNQTSFYLYSSTDNQYSVKDIRTVSGQQITQGTRDYQLIGEWNNEDIQSIEVVFAFATDENGLNQIPADATPKPNTTAIPKPSATPKTTTSTNPSTAPTATSTATTAPQSSLTPSGTFDPSGNIVSNSTYNGQEKIFVNKSSIVVAAGSHGSVTIALLRGASSTTQVTVSSGNSSIAVPTLQPNGKLDIAVPSTAPAGSSAMLTLRFGSSSAAVKVTVSNPVTQIKGAKKSYTIKRKKTAKVSANLTPKNAATAITDTVTASISNKKVASVTSVKVSKNKASIKVKALKKGSAKLTVKASGKSASIKIKVK